MKPLVAKRFLLLALVGSILAGSIAVLRYIDNLPPPSHKTKKVNTMALLTSTDIQQQHAGIGSLGLVKTTDPELATILNTVADIALTSENRGTPRYAVLHIANTLGRKELREGERLLLDPDRLTQLLALLVAADTPIDMMQPLSLIGGHTSRWQTDPKDQIARIIELLEASHQRIHNRVPKDFLVALEGYARHHDLPNNGMNFLQERLHGPYDSSSTISVVHVFKSIAARRALAPAVRQSVVKAITEHKELDVRKESLEVLKAEAKRTGKIPDELYTAEKNENDEQVQFAATTAILVLRIGDSSTYENLLTISHNKNESGPVRLRAIDSLMSTHRNNPDLPENLFKWLADDDVLIRARAMKGVSWLRSNKALKDHHTKLLPYLNAGIQDPDTNIRAESISSMFQLSLPDEQKFRFADLAMQDKEPAVRKMVAAVFHSKTLPHEKSIPYLLQLLQDDDTSVLIAAVNSVRRAGIDTDDIRMHIERLTTSEDKQLQKHARVTLEKMKRDARSPFKKATDNITKFTDAITDTKSYGIFVYWLLIAVGVFIALGFGFYFVILIISYIGAASSRSLAATVALVVWVGMTATMGWGFLFAAFGFGHNSLAPLSEHFIIDAGLLLALVVYAGLGWLIKRLVRVREKTNPLDIETQVRS